MMLKSVVLPIDLFCVSAVVAPPTPLDKGWFSRLKHRCVEGYRGTAEVLWQMPRWSDLWSRSGLQ